MLGIIGVSSGIAATLGLLQPSQEVHTQIFSLSYESNIFGTVRTGLVQLHDISIYLV